ncbi:MAG: cell division protein ZapA [Polyangiaceae bacterium]
MRDTPSKKAAPVEIKLGGQVLRVVVGDDRHKIDTLVAGVEARLAKHRRGAAPIPQNAMALVALELENEVVELREKYEALERKTRDLLRRSMSRIDAALEQLPER